MKPSIGQSAVLNRPLNQFENSHSTTMSSRGVTRATSANRQGIFLYSTNGTRITTASAPWEILTWRVILSRRGLGRQGYDPTSEPQSVASLTRLEFHSPRAINSGFAYPRRLASNPTVSAASTFTMS